MVSNAYFLEVCSRFLEYRRVFFMVASVLFVEVVDCVGESSVFDDNNCVVENSVFGDNDSVYSRSGFGRRDTYRRVFSKLSNVCFLEGCSRFLE